MDVAAARSCNLDHRGTWWWVAVPADVGLSTPEVYAHFDVLFPDALAEPAEPADLLSALASGRRCGWPAPSTTTCRRRRSTCAPSSEP